MKLKKQTKFFVLVLGILVTAILISFPAFSRGKSSWEHVTFVTHRKALKFFDHSTGKIYAYDEMNGKIKRIWLLKELGRNLEDITSNPQHNT